MSVINAVLCWWTAYVAFALMAHKHPPTQLRDMILHGGLAVVFALGIAAGLMPLLIGKDPQVWTVGYRIGLFVVASAVYDMVFADETTGGIKRHWLQLRERMRLWK